MALTNIDSEEDIYSTSLHIVQKATSILAILKQSQILETGWFMRALILTIIYNIALNFNTFFQ